MIISFSADFLHEGLWRNPTRYAESVFRVVLSIDAVEMEGEAAEHTHPNGEVSFALYDYSNNWARAAMGLAVFFTWPVMALGSLVLFSAVVLGFW